MRLRCAVPVLAFVVLAFGTPATGAFAKTKKGLKTPPAAKIDWHFFRNAPAPTLVYGTTAKDFQISFACLPENGLLRIVSQIGSRGLQPGDGAAIRLVSGKNRFEIAGTAFSTETRNEVDVGGATRMDPDLFVLFKGDKLIVEVPGRKRALPIEHAGPSADQFQKACSATVAAAHSTAG